MRIIALIQLTLAFLISSIRVQAQPGQIRFQPFPENELLGSVHATYQDSLGFLWLNSNRGLFRWDGADGAFFLHQKGDTTSIASNEINDIAIGKNLNLWVATSLGLSRFDRKTKSFRTFLRDSQVISVVDDGQGSIWAGTREQGVFRIFRGTFEIVHYSHDPEDSTSIAGDKVAVIRKAQNGDLWMAVPGVGISIYNHQKNSFTHLIADPAHPERLPSARFRDLLQAKDGTFWIAASKGGLTHYDPVQGTYEQFQPNPDDPNSINSLEAYSLLEDRKGQIWVGTWGRGLNILDPVTKKFRHFRHQPDYPNSLPDDVITHLHQDQEGLIWVGSAYGNLASVDPRHDAFVHYRNNPQDDNSLSENFVRGIYEVSENELWMGTSHGGLNIYHRDEGRFELHTHDPQDAHSLANNTIWDIERGSNGQMWVATSGGICQWRPQSRDWITLRKSPGDPHSLSANTVLCLTEGPDGTLWGGTWNEGLNAINPKTGYTIRFLPDDKPGSIPRTGFKEMLFDSQGRFWLALNVGLALFQPEDSTFELFSHDPYDPTTLPSDGLNCIVEDRQGRLAIGTNNGFAIFDPETMTSKNYTTEEGLSSDEILGVELGEGGSFWLSTGMGINHFDPTSGQVEVYTYPDGVQANHFGVWSHHRGESGRYYFGGANGLNEFFAEDLRIDSTHSPTAITGFYLFNQPVQIHPDSILTQSLLFTEEITLSYSDYIFAFSFSSLTNRKNDRCEYAYRLKGFNENWIYADQRNRRATFTNVSPGKYIFQVRSKNGDGVWDDPGAEVAIRILPPWWQTWWFRGGVILLLLGLAYTIYYSRVATLRRQKRILLQRVEEATGEVLFQNRLLSQQKEEIEKEKERSDKLLLNILPEAVAEELKRNNKATPRYFPEVSILFSDFIGFTKLSEGMSPQELVEVLDGIFRQFDQIVERHQLEKIKTIGDAYMCVGGLHNEPLGQANKVVAAGLEMVECIHQFNIEQAKAGRPEWNIRLGIHTGEVVAGVVGQKKFQFDIWGDAVNTASRMESSGEKDRVNISHSTYERVKAVYRCSPRGRIPAKNKGEIEMFLVEGKI